MKYYSLYKVLRVLKYLHRIRSWKQFQELVWRLSRTLSNQGNKLYFNLLAPEPSISHSQFHLMKDYKPLVSIVVPNFNHSRYIVARLNSIQNQTYKNWELLVLDDASTDDSVAIIKNWLNHQHVSARLITNSTNSGSTLKQWKKGIDLAKGDLVWIAESDDLADPTFLEVMVNEFQNRAIQLAFSNTYFFESNPQEPMWKLKDYWFSRTTLNTKDYYIGTLEMFLRSGFNSSNLIPNVSSVLFRRSAIEFIDIQSSTYRFAFDWLFYATAIGAGLISYVPKVLNFYRIHDSSTIKLNLETLEFKEEIKEVMTKVAALMASTRILVAIPALDVGGGEMVPIRIVSACNKKGHYSALVNLNLFQPSCEAELGSGFVGPYFNLKSPRVGLQAIVKNFEVINSHHPAADIFLNRNLSVGTKRIINLHGMYEEMAQFDLKSHFKELLKRQTSFIYCAEKNLRSFPQEILSRNRFIKLSNFVPDDFGGSQSQIKLLGEVKFLVLGRPLVSKGWIEAFELVKLIRSEHSLDAHLYYVGDGKLLEFFKRSIVAEWVHFVGYESDPSGYIKESDIGLHLSTYLGESFPLTVIEFLRMGKFVLATDVGEVHEILRSGNQRILPLLNVENGRIDLDKAVDHVSEYLSKSEKEKSEIRKQLLIQGNKFSEEKYIDSFLSICRT